MILGLSIQAYHASNHASASKLKTYASLGAYAYWSRYVQRVTTDDTSKSYFAIGQMLEDAAQGRGFDDNKYAVKPHGMEFRTKEAKQWRDDHLAAGRQIVTESELRDVREMITALGDNKTALSMIAMCESQVTLRRDYAGLPGVQSRPDWMYGGDSSGNGSFTLDLKSTSDFNGFLKYEIRKYAYHAQAAIAQYCHKTDGDIESWLLVCESSFPYRCQLVRLPDSWLSAGWALAEEQLEKLCRNYETGEWPRVETEIAELPPFWLNDDKENA